MKNCKHSSYERNTRDAVCYTSSRLSFIAFSDWLSTVIMKDTRICLAAKPHICLCFQIIRQLWSAVNGQRHFSHFTPPLSSSSFKIIYAFFSPLSLNPKRPRGPANESLMLKYIWGQTATAEMMLIRVAFGWNPSSSPKHIVMHSLSKLFVCMYPVPFKWFFSLFWPKDVCFALRHWTNNQQDLRVGLGFLQAVILRVLLRHKHHLLTPVSMEKRVKNSLFWGFFFLLLWENAD